MKNRLTNRLKNIRNSLSIKRQISSIITFATVAIFIINLSLFYSIDKQLTKFDDVYASNEYNTKITETVNSIQENTKEYILSKETTALSDYYLHTEELKNLCENMEYSSDPKIAIMQKNVVKIAENYIETTDEAMQSKRGRNVIKYRESYEEASNIYTYLCDYIYSLNTIQFQQNTGSYLDVNANLKIFEGLCMAILVLVIIAELILTGYLTNRITTPLMELTDKAKEVADGNLDVAFESGSRKDEIGVMTDAFETMVTNLKYHMANEKKAMEEQRDTRERELKMKAKVKDAELKYYQSQTDPHFLFNTLNACMQLAMLEGAPRSSEYIGNAAQFFRYNLKKDNGITTLEEELKLVDYYMAILAVRFGDDIKLEKKIDPNICSVMMPKMVIQPIIENAVNYGIVDMEEGGKIYLSVYEESDEIIVSVLDNGKGLSKDIIDSIMEGTYKNNEKKRSSNGVGINNIISRLRLYYNKEHVLELISEGEGKGLEVLIHIPKPVEE